MCGETEAQTTAQSHLSRPLGSSRVPGWPQGAICMRVTDTLGETGSVNGALESRPSLGGRGKGKADPYSLRRVSQSKEHLSCFRSRGLGKAQVVWSSSARLPPLQSQVNAQILGASLLTRVTVSVVEHPFGNPGSFQTVMLPGFRISRQVERAEEGMVTSQQWKQLNDFCSYSVTRMSHKALSRCWEGDSSSGPGGK